ncbi:MAG: hypothetical protein IKS97_08070 [Fibrobacter sp.]|nr:hypothetical protein [Fibrobacter sp.]
MKIEIANIEDVPELLELHDKAFFAIAAEVDWLDAPRFEGISGAGLRRLSEIHDA